MWNSSGGMPAFCTMPRILSARASRGSGGFKRQFRTFPGKAVHYLYKYREMPVNFTVPAAGKKTD